MRRTQYPELPDSIMLPAVTHDTDDGADGFSLLELVVAVSIMLILGVVGFIAYQTYTDNARQANVDSQANQVLTAAVAADNTPGDDVNSAVRQYNKTTSEITANITEADANSMTITATDQDGTVGVASIAGNYSGVETTNFSDPGVTYEWTGERGLSTSVKKVNGEVVEETILPGFNAWELREGDEILSPSHIFIRNGAYYDFEIPEDVDRISYYYEVRSTEPSEGEEHAIFHNTYIGSDTNFGRAIRFPADGAWHKSSTHISIGDSHDIARVGFYSEHSKYTTSTYEVRNIQAVYNYEEKPEFFDGDSA